MAQLEKTLVAMRNTALQKNLKNQKDEMVILNIAYARMLEACGMLDADDCRAIIEGMKKTAQVLDQPGAAKDDDTDLFYLVERVLYAAIGEETGCKLHIGRSRNDIYCALTRMEMRKSIWQVAERLLELQELLLQKARENTDTILSYYTYGQPSQPGTLAHYYVTVAERFNRDLERLQAAYRRTNCSPMGAAAGIGSSFHVDKKMMCELLGFDSVMENSLDAITAMDYMLDIEYACASMMTTVSKVADDMFFWACQEYRILLCDDSISGGSSIMPQKHNAECVEGMRMKAAYALNLLHNGMTLTHNTSIFPLSDNFETTYMYWEHMTQTLSALDLFMSVLRHSRIDQERAREICNQDFTGATSLAEQLTIQSGIAFTQTHHVVGGMIHTLLGQDALTPEHMTGDLMQKISKEKLGTEIVMTTGQIGEYLSPAFALDSKVTGGTPRKEDTLALLQTVGAEVEEKKHWLQQAQAQVHSAYERTMRGC